MFPLVCLLVSLLSYKPTIKADGFYQFAGVSIMTTSSRMVYAFARDRGLPASRFFAKVDKRLDVPMNALWLTLILVTIFGCIFLGSSSAL